MGTTTNVRRMQWASVRGQAPSPNAHFVTTDATPQGSWVSAAQLTAVPLHPFSGVASSITVVTAAMQLPRNGATEMALRPAAPMLVLRHTE
jgi:hypothetical protein